MTTLNSLKLFGPELATKSFLLKFVLISLSYSLLTFTIIEYEAVTSFLSTSVPLVQKLAITPSIILSSFTAMTPTMKLGHIIIAALFSLNILLVAKRFGVIRTQNSLRLNFGAGFISLGATGCTSCGISVLSVLGLGGAISTLPFQGAEIIFATISILTLTLIYNLNSFTKVCEIKSNGH